MGGLADPPTRPSAMEILNWLREHLFPGYLALEKRVAAIESTLSMVTEMAEPGSGKIHTERGEPEPMGVTEDGGEVIMTVGSPTDHPMLIHTGGGWYQIEHAAGARSGKKQMARDAAIEWFADEASKRAA